MLKNYSPCRNCIDYISSPSNRESGFCDRVGDPNFVFHAYTDPKFKCLFENGPRETLSNQEAEKRWQKVQEDEKSFSAALEYAKRVVDSWPEWKKRPVRETVSIPKQPNYRL
jgi:hypothetical protein